MRGALVPSAFARQRYDFLATLGRSFNRLDVGAHALFEPM